MAYPGKVPTRTRQDDASQRAGAGTPILPSVPGQSCLAPSGIYLPPPYRIPDNQIMAYQSITDSPIKSCNKTDDLTLLHEQFKGVPEFKTDSTTISDKSNIKAALSLLSADVMIVRNTGHLHLDWNQTSVRANAQKLLLRLHDYLSAMWFRTDHCGYSYHISSVLQAELDLGWPPILGLCCRFHTCSVCGKPDVRKRPKVFPIRTVLNLMQLYAPIFDQSVTGERNGRCLDLIKMLWEMPHFDQSVMGDAHSDQSVMEDRRDDVRPGELDMRNAVAPSPPTGHLGDPTRDCLGNIIPPIQPRVISKVYYDSYKLSEISSPHPFNMYLDYFSTLFSSPHSQSPTTRTRIAFSRYLNGYNINTGVGDFVNNCIIGPASVLFTTMGPHRVEIFFSSDSTLRNRECTRPLGHTIKDPTGGAPEQPTCKTPSNREPPAKKLSSGRHVKNYNDGNGSSQTRYDVGLNLTKILTVTYGVFSTLLQYGRNTRSWIPLSGGQHAQSKSGPQLNGPADNRNSECHSVTRDPLKESFIPAGILRCMPG
ncbi:hypothetical protein J6590_051997 [Homalodisca vitripennis]|nr:hypothetical protein J6590_051997 [Homalodisca vitripennis]